MAVSILIRHRGEVAVSPCEECNIEECAVTVDFDASTGMVSSVLTITFGIYQAYLFNLIRAKHLSD